MKRPPSACFSLAPAAVVALLAGCADLNDTGLAALATRVPAYAIVNEQLVQGEMTLFPDHTGTVTLRGQTMPGVGADGVAVAAPAPASKLVLSSCVGRLRYTATTMGSIDLRCNDGSVSDLRMALIGETRGYGYGQTATGLVSLTFGLGPVEARAHLTVPPNRQLVEGTDSSNLELR
ncbi:MAG: hypothetical protein WAW73_06175 [Rhodoferax sp.]